VDDGRAASGCGNLRQKRPLRKRKRKRKGGGEAAGEPEGRQHGRGRHLSWVSALDRRKMNGNVQRRIDRKPMKEESVRGGGSEWRKRRKESSENHDLLG